MKRKEEEGRGRKRRGAADVIVRKVRLRKEADVMRKFSDLRI